MTRNYSDKVSLLYKKKCGSQIFYKQHSSQNKPHDVADRYLSFIKLMCGKDGCKLKAGDWYNTCRFTFSSQGILKGDFCGNHDMQSFAQRLHAQT